VTDVTRGLSEDIIKKPPLFKTMVDNVKKKRNKIVGRLNV
jgi:hypothetical protein